MTPAVNHSALLQVVLKDVNRHDIDISKLQTDLSDVKLTLTALAVKVGIYAAIGASIGGAAVGAIITIVLG